MEPTFGGQKMIDGKRVLAIIPARGGSKRFPGKNLAMFHGEPLLVHSVKQALACKYVDSVVVSSDSEAILALVEPPAIALRRPPELSTDDARTEDAIRHALAHYPCDLFVLLQPTSPTRSIEDINLIIWYAQAFGGTGKAHTTSGNKDPNGSVYASTDTTFRYGHLTNHSIPIWVPAERSHDINTPEDLERAQRA